MVFLFTFTVLLDLAFIFSTFYIIAKRIIKNRKETQRIFNEAMQNIQTTGMVIQNEDTY